MRSLSFRIRPAGPRQTSFPASLGAGRTLSGGCAAPAVRGPLSAPYPASGPSRVRRVAFVRRQVPMVRWQLCCDRLLTRPTGQPRHAACVSTPPSKPCRPRAWERHGQRKGLHVVIMPQEPASGKRERLRHRFRRHPPGVSRTGAFVPWDARIPDYAKFPVSCTGQRPTGTIPVRQEHGAGASRFPPIARSPRGHEGRRSCRKKKAQMAKLG